MKYKKILVILVIITMVITGCGKKNNTGNTGLTPTLAGTATTAPTTAATTAPTTAPTTAATTGPTGTDVVTTASIVNTNDAFINAISANGTWIIAILQDMNIGQDLVLDGDFKNGKKDDAGNDIYQRKLAFYSQDANRNITARYTLTAPKLTINSKNASIQHGTFKGDLYVNVDNFQLIDATVNGNIYFTAQSNKDTFTMDATSAVTGTQGLKTP